MRPCNPPDMQRRLDILKAVRTEQTVWDVHLHPLEIFFDKCRYRQAECEGLFSAGQRPYQAPSPPTDLEDIGGVETSAIIRQRPALAGMMLTGRYAHTGPRVFDDMCAMSGVDRGLLLPVDPAEAVTGSQTEQAGRMFASTSRFALAGSVPGAMVDEDVPVYLAAAKVEQGIAALKIHPNLSAIDLTSAAGRRRWHCLVSAAGALNLPVITHVGQSDLLVGPSATFADLVHLAQAELAAPVPIVFAHGCGYGMSPDRMTEEGLPILRRLMERHDHLLVDTSGLDLQQIILLLQAIGPERVLFGSDALYHSQWSALHAVVAAVVSIGGDIETTLAGILGGNARQRLFPHDESMSD